MAGAALHPSHTRPGRPARQATFNLPSCLMTRHSFLRQPEAGEVGDFALDNRRIAVEEEFAPIGLSEFRLDRECVLQLHRCIFGRPRRSRTIAFIAGVKNEPLRSSSFNAASDSSSLPSTAKAQPL